MDPNRLRAIDEGEAAVVRGGETIATLSHWDVRRVGDALDELRAKVAERRPAR